MSRAGGVPPAEPPRRVLLPVNIHVWEHISFLHWPVELDAVQRLLPEGFTALTYGGMPWVSVTPFRIRVRPAGLPSIPVVSVFPETNLRTYVTGPDGREGLWFLHMEVTRRWFVATLRTLGLPYVRRHMLIDTDGSVLRYRSVLPGAAETSHEVAVRPGAALSPSAGGALERFLTARWGAYHGRGRWLLYTPADHPPWPLHHVEVIELGVEGLFRHARLEPPAAAPVAHFSPGVRVKIGRPELVARMR